MQNTEYKKNAKYPRYDGYGLTLTMIKLGAFGLTLVLIIADPGYGGYGSHTIDGTPTVWDP